MLTAVFFPLISQKSLGSIGPHRRNGSSSRPLSSDGSEPGQRSVHSGAPQGRPVSAASPTVRHEERAGVSWDEQGIKTVHGGRGPRKITPERGPDGDELQEHSAPAALGSGCALKACAIAKRSVFV
jgi:hypothetical protein